MVLRQIRTISLNTGESPLSLNLYKCADLIVYHSTDAEPPACITEAQEVRFNISTIIFSFRNLKIQIHDLYPDAYEREQWIKTENRKHSYR